jgi:hypothetical protein
MKFRDDVGRQVELGHAVEEDRAPGEEEDGYQRVFVALGVVHFTRTAKQYFSG